MELLGSSLEDLFQAQQKKFSIKNVSMVGIQMLDRLEFIHNKNIIHRDIKPDNFTIGMDNKNHIIYALDFGLSKKYRSTRTHQHIKFNQNKKLTGTARYASINALKGYEQSRRDDLEAIGYVLMYFLRGSLPWQGLHVHKGEDRYKKILMKKKGTTAEELCKGFPNEFVDYINYTRNLDFEADPDYKYLRGLLLSILVKEKCTYDFWYDWVKEKPNITEHIAVERYMKGNYNISLEISGDNKKEKEGEAKNENSNEKENNMNMNYAGLNTSTSNNDNNAPMQYNSEFVKTNSAGINIPVDNNNISSNSIGKNDESLDKKDGKKSKDKKNKKDKNKNGEKDKREKNCLIW